MSLIWLEAVLGAAIPLGWGFWQLHALRRDRRRAAQPPAIKQADEGGQSED